MLMRRILALVMTLSAINTCLWWGGKEIAGTVDFLSRIDATKRDVNGQRS